MKKLIIGIMVALATASVFAAGAAFTYQGVIKEVGGTAPVNKNRTIEFRIYDSPTGDHVLWGRAYSVLLDENGLFNTALTDAAGSAISGVTGTGLAKVLADKGIQARVLDMHTIKPLDQEAVTACIDEIGRIVTVEDHNILNGLGSAVCEVAAELGKGKVKRLGIQDQFGQSAPYERLLAMNGVTVENIVAQAEALIG